VLELVRAAASTRVRALFSDPSIVGQQQADQYKIDGNILCAFLEEAEAMLSPLRAEHSSIHIKLWDFMRCATIACKTVSTLECEGFAERLEAYPACIERFIQWIFHFASNLYVERPYLPLARYVWFFQAKQMWTLHHIPHGMGQSASCRMPQRQGSRLSRATGWSHQPAYIRREPGRQQVSSGFDIPLHRFSARRACLGGCQRLGIAPS
jgi:hypothetical protein